MMALAGPTLTYSPCPAAAPSKVKGQASPVCRAWALQACWSKNKSEPHSSKSLERPKILLFSARNALLRSLHRFSRRVSLDKVQWGGKKSRASSTEGPLVG